MLVRPAARRLRTELAPRSRRALRALGPLLLLLAGAAPSCPAAARSAEAVAVRAATHDGFGRLVLEWPAPVEVDGRQQGSRYRLRFGRPLGASLDAALARLGDYLESAALAPTDRELALDLAPGIVVRQDVYEGRIVVLDLAPAVGPDTVRLRTGLHRGFGRIVFDWPRPTTFDAVTAAEQVAIRFSRAGDIDPAILSARLRAWLADASALHRHGRSEVRLDLRPGVAARVFKVDDDRVAVDLFRAPGRLAAGTQAASPRPSEPAPSPASPTVMSALAPAPEPAAPPPAPTVAPPDRVDAADVAITARVTGAGADLDFTWTAPVGAAVFSRAGYLWVVFAARTGGPDDLVLPPLGPELRGYLGQGERIEASGGTAIRFPLHRPFTAEVRREERAWRVRLRADAHTPQPVHPLRLASPARLRLAPGEAPRLVTLRDPEAGDRLTVWPLLQANLGQSRQRLVDLELLATAQGLAWRLRSDRVHARALDAAVEFEAPGGLALSSGGEGELSDTEVQLVPPAGHGGPTAAVSGPERVPLDEPEPTPETPSHAQMPRVSDDPAAPAVGLSGWGLDPASTSPGRRLALLRALAESGPDQRDARRLDLARYYLSKGLAAEVVGVLGAIDHAADAATGRARQALTGAAELLMGRIDAAEAALGAAHLDDDPEVALWRAAVAAAREDWPAAAHELARSEQTLVTYPPALQLRLGLSAASIAIETEDTGLAAMLLDQLDRLHLAPGERARLAFLTGLASARDGDVASADGVWRTLEQDAPVEVRVQAGFARTQLLLEAGELEPAEAIARLAPLRGLWRGHPEEEGMLAALARIYADDRDRPNAIRTWGELLGRFPETADAATITKRMRQTLIEALLAAGDAELEPVQAYALFREFEELIPDDEQGDGLRRRMADRLAGLDLIQPAAALLDTVLTDRLRGVARADVGADLAALRLRERAPEAALAALERTRAEARLPPALTERRRMLRAPGAAPPRSPCWRIRARPPRTICVPKFCGRSRIGRI